MAEAVFRVPPDRLLAAIDGELYRRRLKEFLVASWGIIHPAQRLVDAWYLDAICDHLEAVTKGWIQKLLINIPPRFGKSTIVSVQWPAWWWALDATRQFLCVSGIEKVVMRDAVQMRQLVESRWYQEHFAPGWARDRDQDAKGFFCNTAKGHRISQTTGARSLGLGGNCQIIDDPHDAQEVRRSSIVLERDRIFLNEVLPERKNNKDDPTVCIMQRLDELDYSGDIRRNQTGWTILELPNEFDGERRRTIIVLGGEEKVLFEDPRTEKGELLCPDRCDEPRIEELKETLGEANYQARYNQKPTSPEGRIFHDERFQYWIPGQLPEFDFICASWDFAFTKSEESDYVVGQIWGVKGALAYLLYQVRERLEFSECLDAMLDQQEFCQKEFGTRPRFVVVEAKANGPEIIEKCKETIPGIYGYNPQGETKAGRARACQGFYKARQVYIPHYDHFAWVRNIYKPELLHFRDGQRGHDDQVDATTQALLNIFEMGGAWVSRATRD